MIDNSKRPGSTSTSTSTSSLYTGYAPIERGPIFGFSTWEAYEANIKSSHLIYQSIIEEIYPTVGEQIEMKNNFINHVESYLKFGRQFSILALVHGDHQDIYLEGKEKLFLEKCYEASKTKEVETSQHSFCKSFS